MASVMRRCTLSYLIVLVALNMANFLSCGKHHDDRTGLSKKSTKKSDIDYQLNEQDDYIPMYMTETDVFAGNSASKSSNAKKESAVKATKAPATKATPAKAVTTKAAATKAPATKAATTKASGSKDAKATTAKATAKASKAATTPAPTKSKKATEAATVKAVKPTQTKKTEAKPTAAAAKKESTAKTTKKPTEKTTPKPTAATPKTPAQTTAKVTVKPTTPNAAKTQAAKGAVTKPTTKPSKPEKEAKAATPRCQKRWPWIGRVLTMTDCKIEYCDKEGKVGQYVLKSNAKQCTNLQHPAAQIACPVRNKLYYHNHVVRYDPCSIFICSSGIPRELRKKNCKTNKPYEYF